MRSVRQLYELQLLDWEILKLEEELAEVLKRLADDSKRATARRRLGTLEKRLDELGPPRRQSEHAVQQFEQRIESIDGRLYSGVVTNPRELEAYQDERTSLTRNLRGEEDRLLELMVQTEETQQQQDAARAVFEEVHTEREEELAELGSRHKELSTDLPGRRSRRQTISSEYAPSVMAVYETVRRSRGGHGAALIDRRGLCQGCRLVIPQAELSQVRAGDAVVQCGSCARILIYE